MKKLVVLALIGTMVFPSSAFAADILNNSGQEVTKELIEISPKSVNMSTTYWVDKYGKPVIEKEGSQKTLGTYTAGTDGETYTASASIGYTHTYSGTIVGNLKNVIQVSLGYSFGKSMTFTGGPTSRALKKGETVKATYYKTYEVTPVTQTTCKHTYGYKYVNGHSVPVDEYDYKTTNVNAKRAIAPTITLSYSKPRARKALNSLGVENNITSIETYKLIGHEYKLVHREEFN